MEYKKITILLGAGFAQYCKGLSTKDINDIFSNYSRWSIGDITLYDYMLKELANDYYDFNFETFLAILEHIFSYRLSQFREGKTSTSWKGLSSTIFYLKDEFELCACLKDQESSYEVLRSYINLIIDNVANYDDCTKCKIQIDKFKKYIHYLKDNKYDVKIYSTNYDHIVPKALGICGTGLGVSNDTMKQEFIYDIDGFRQSKLSYFPLHGCSYIYQEPYGKFYLSSVMQRMPLYAQSNRGGNPNTETLFTPIISGYSKLEHINGRPFNFGLQAFANDCFDSDLIVTMGYSFSDPHINSIVETFSKCNIESITLHDEPKLSTPLGEIVNTNTDGIEKYISDIVNRTNQRCWIKIKLIKMINSIRDIFDFCI